nr:MAG: hypothetical protein DIU75_11700 [Mycolicibacterium hassiacum]
MRPKKLSPEVRAVIDAVREALDIPAAAPYPGDRERRAEVLDARARVLLYHLGRLVDVADRREGGRVDVQARMASLRSWLAAYPATGYTQADGDGDGGRENDGWACVVCGVDYTATPELIPNVPVGTTMDGSQVFACTGCARRCRDCGGVKYCETCEGTGWEVAQ